MGNLVLNGSTSGAITVSPTAIAGSNTLTLPAKTGNIITSADSATVTPTMLSQPLTSATVQATTSGTSINFTSIPSWVKRITFTLNGVSSSGTSPYQIQLGYGAGPTYQTTNYTGGSYNSAAGIYNTNAPGIAVATGMLSSSVWSGGSTISLMDAATNTWAAFGFCGDAAGASGIGITQHGWSVPLSGTLTAVRFTTVNGTDTFDAGKVNILYE